MSFSSSDPEPTLRGPAAGQRVFGRYTLTGMLGRGGMGVVWRAHDETLGEDIALKFLPDAVRWDPAAFDDLKAETRRARQLTHPNIVRIHDFAEDAGAAAISMELVDGATLTQLRLEKPSRVLEVAGVAAWLPQLGAALDYAHMQARVVHRDLKPSNLMLTREGVLKVADFGVARSLADSVTRVSMMSAGTLVYMSPQQAMGEEPSPADDGRGAESGGRCLCAGRDVVRIARGQAAVSHGGRADAIVSTEAGPDRGTAEGARGRCG